MSFIIITIPVQFLPYAMLTITLVMAGPGTALSQASGLVAAHLFDFLTRLYPVYGGGTNYIKTPAFVRAWFSNGRRGNGSSVRGYGTAFTARPGSGNARASSTGYNSGLGSISNLWSNRGAGRRLGE